MPTLRSHRRASLVGAASRYAQGDLDPFDARAYGFLAWSYPLWLTSSAGQTPFANQLNMVKVWVPRTITVNNVSARVLTAGATLTAGANFATIYDSSGNKIGETADQSTAWTSTGTKTMALTAPVVITGGPGVFVWVSLKATGTTLPAFAKAGPGDATANNGALPVAQGFAVTTSSTFATTTPASFTPTTGLVTSAIAYGVALL